MGAKRMDQELLQPTQWNQEGANGHYILYADKSWSLYTPQGERIYAANSFCDEPPRNGWTATVLKATIAIKGRGELSGEYTKGQDTGIWTSDSHCIYYDSIHKSWLLCPRGKLKPIYWHPVANVPTYHSKPPTDGWEEVPRRRSSVDYQALLNECEA